MGNYTIILMFENPRRGRQARNFTTNVSKILDLKSSSEQIFFRKLSLDAPDTTAYWIALAPARKPCRIWLLFTHKNGDFVAITVTERSCTALISKVESRISDRFCAKLWCSLHRYLDRTGNGIRQDGSNYSGVRTGIYSTMFDVCERPVPVRYRILYSVNITLVVH